MADPGFPREGRQSIILPKFAENCMKIKKIGRDGKGICGGRGGCVSKIYYVDPPLVWSPVKRINMNH